MSAIIRDGGRTTAEEQRLLDARFASLAARERLLPVKVSGFYRAKIEAEVAALGHTEGPLHRGAHPPRERFGPAAGHEVDDWVDDRSNMPVGGHPAIIHKYADRVLFMPTSVCAGHCQYCFRQDVLSESHGSGRTDVAASLAALLDYLAARPGVREVILSGGDPMTLPTRDIALVLEALRRLPQLSSIRIHTRSLAFQPKLFADPERTGLLAGAKVRLVHHFIHPYEVCDEVEATIAGLGRAGIRQYNHFPLLRGTNDHVEVVRRLIERLDDTGVRTLSVYVPEPIRYSAPYRVPLARFFAIQDALTETAPGWINAVRFTLDSPLGKVRRDQIVASDPARGTVTFRRGGREIRYPDFPAALDVPGELPVMLWRG